MIQFLETRYYRDQTVWKLCFCKNRGEWRAELWEQKSRSEDATCLGDIARNYDLGYCVAEAGRYMAREYSFPAE